MARSQSRRLNNMTVMELAKAIFTERHANPMLIPNDKLTHGANNK